jgi:HlyD family secretion protein
MRIRTLATVVASALVAALVLAGCAGRAGGAPAAVKVVEAHSANIVREVSLSGVLAPSRTVNLYPKLSGQVKEIAVDVGDTVKQGQVVMRIDVKELAAQFQVAEASMSTVRDQAAQAKGGIETARLNLDMAQKNFDRSKALFETKVVTQSQIDDAQTKLDLAKSAYDNAQRQYQTVGGSGLDQAEAQANLIRVQISNGEITSPISGRVTNRNVNPGELSSPTSPLMTIADTDNLKLQGNLSQGEVLAIKVGDRVRVSVDGLAGSGYEGRVAQIGPIAAATGQYFPVAVAVRNDGKLLAGMTAKALLSLSSEKGVVLPLSAIARRGNDSIVFVVKEGRAVEQAVVLGSHNASETIVLSGVEPGESIVASGTASLKDGSEVSR